MLGIAFAQDGAAAPTAPTGPAAMLQFAPFLIIILIFYFLLIRPQQKRAKEHQDFLQALKKGDAVVTTGGLFGTITGLNDKFVTLEIADNVRVKIARQHVMGSPKDVTAVGEEGAPKSGG